MKTFETAAAMPAPTWHFLNMNDARITLPERLTQFPATARAGVRVDADGSAFERAMAEAQMAWEQTHPAPTEAERAERAQFLAAEADATYGGTAQSAYQARADALEESRSLVVAFEHGMGAEVAEYVRAAAGKHLVIETSPDGSVDAQVVVPVSLGAITPAAIDVIAHVNSSVRLSLVVDEADETSQTADSENPGVAATSVRVFAGAGAQVDIVRTQTLGSSAQDIDDMGLFVGDDARVRVKQTVLGAKASFTGLAGDLRGMRSQVEVRTAYLGQGEQERDFNFSLRHHGEQSRSTMLSDGVLAGRSRKSLRGTIDLVRGCKGAEGTEHENVLIIDEGVRNKTVPVILCSEDDVAGNHGATIGHLGDEQLFYLASRGFSPDEAERLFMTAAVEKAVIEAPDDEARAGILRWAKRTAPGFSGLFDGEETIDG